MSEAESLNRDCDVSEPAESVVEAGAQAESSTTAPLVFELDGDWQTVNFPGAIGVDMLPTGEISVTPDAPASDLEVVSALASLNQSPAPDGEQQNSSIPHQAEVLVQSLQQEVDVLQERVAELENDLAQQQIELQLEHARSLHAQPETLLSPASEAQPANDLVSELRSSQSRIAHLLKELELSQQTTQRQQILVETLSEQLESSQERIAQLERDCALSQQRYNEQVQKLLQAENSCRDLRMRLHRQQRQTLQFKAALEKCLEMPPTQGQSLLLNPEVSITAPPVVVPPIASAQVTTPKNQPVKPWSAIVDPALNGGEESEFSKPLAKIVRLHSASDADMIAPDSKPNQQVNAGQSSDWADQLFANSSDSPLYSGMSSDQANAFFDPALLMASGEGGDAASEPPAIDPMIGSEPVANTEPGDAGLLKMLASVPLDADELGNPLGSFWGRQNQDDPLWDDLEKLIDRPATAQAAQPAQVAPTSSDAKTAQPEDASPLVADSEQTKVKAAIGKKPLELVSWAARKVRNDKPEPSVQQEDSQVAIAPLPAKPAPARSFALKPNANSTDATGTPALNVELLTPGSPSPVVYPLRPSKKLKSLAAVDLPTFPRAR